MKYLTKKNRLTQEVSGGKWVCNATLVLHDYVLVAPRAEPTSTVPHSGCMSGKPSVLVKFGSGLTRLMR